MTEESKLESSKHKLESRRLVNGTINRSSMPDASVL
jgi:hypothetical protein